MIICGFLSRNEKKTEKSCDNGYTWVPIVVGFAMMLMGFLSLMKKKGGGMLSPAPMKMDGADPMSMDGM